MKCKDIIHILEKLAPEKLAMSWDNVGLLVGRKDKSISKVLVTLDITDDVIEQAVEKQVDMISSHHPLIFKGVKSITTEDFIGRRLFTLISNDICCYAMHTNFDMAENGMGELAAKKLNLLHSRCIVKEATYTKENGECISVGCGRVGELEEPISLRELCEKVKKQFHIDSLNVYGASNMNTYMVSKIAICPGSGKDYLKDVLKEQVDVYITGDITHHVGLDGADQGIVILDGGHFGIENIFVEYMESYLNQELSAGIEVIASENKVPYLTV